MTDFIIVYHKGFGMMVPRDVAKDLGHYDGKDVDSAELAELGIAAARYGIERCDAKLAEIARKRNTK